ncbi:MAG: nuclease-related domain-containing protein [Anaerolineae bacterium]
MRVITNEPLIKKQATAARRALTIGLTLLFAAMMLSLNPRSMLMAYLVMLLGIIVLNWAAVRGNKWLRNPRFDQELVKVLKGLNHGSRLYHYVLPADHVLLSPAGLFVLKVKPQEGQISCHGEKWRHHFNLGRFLRTLFEERLGNPTRQALLETERLRRFIAKHLPDAEVPIQPVIVFTHPKAELDVVEPTMPVLPLEDLKAYLRNATTKKNLRQETLQALTQLFDEQIP